MIRFIYTFFITLLLPFAFIRLYWRGRKNKGYRQHWAERFGSIAFRLEACIWIHAVSLGETIAAEPLIKRLLNQYPNLPIVITSLTPTGRARALTLAQERVHVCHLPYDLPWLLKRFIKKVNPKILILMETELWPNLLEVTHKKAIPITLANARLSKRSARGYSYISALTRNMLNHITVVAAQNREDGNRFVKLGLPKERLIVTGSIKFDLSIPESVAQKSAPLKAMWQNRPVWIAASTHPGEEEQILSAHKQILSTFPNALLILVPRHPERFLMVKTLCETQGFQVVTRSSNSPCTPETQVYLGDSVGELLVYYASVPIAFVGGSLVNTGGHNTLEPAALGLALITGPHTFNFKEITRMLKKAGASISVESSQALAKEVTRLLEDAALCKGMGEKALSTVLANRGALDRLLAIIAHEMPQ